MSYTPPTQVTADNLDQVTEDYRRRAENADLAADRVLAIRAVGRSAQGLVEVTVDGSAVVVDIEFSAGAPSSHAALGFALKQAHDRAVAEWNRQVKAIAEETLPDDPQLRDHMAAQSDADLLAHIDPANLEDDDESRP
ncbi:YbaB/EbfC family nucleoid-associated protein [Nocardioides terrigena]|uniref:YbaB/EbfC family nucleoid-associated protein n=1 Tax=Nocardioides terrigena TaxID=424797 RepID=UPI000D306E1B|nr:YbaB/EbfC family nucleoid-associated protein [Nocardioides terrigena]